LYADTRPHNQLTANLQKGLILVSDGIELGGEGIGLGVPAIRYRDRTYFSGSSNVNVEHTRNRTKAVKKFILDLTSERTISNAQVENKATRKIRRSFDELYMKHRSSRLLKAEDLLRRIGVRRKFVYVKPVGSALMTYNVEESRIRVNVEFKLNEKTVARKFYLLNEQSSKYFRKYYDSKGTVLLDKEIGAWETVNADWACITSLQDHVGFRLWKHRGAVLHRGREFLTNMFDWIGLDYEADPENTCFEYDIDLVRSHI
jgi:hypothetical protein